MDVITSRTNPTVRLVRSLTTRRAVRYRERLFVAEGLRAVTSLLDHGSQLPILLIDADRHDEVPETLLAAADAAEARMMNVSSDVFQYLSDVEAPQPVIGVFSMARQEIPPSPRVVVALDGIQDPGNLGSILRTCRAAGVDAILMLRGTVDPYNPKVVRATAGLFGDIPMIPVSTIDQMVSEFPELPGRIVVADSTADTFHTDFDWRVPFVLVLGGEASGVSQNWHASNAHGVRIDMEPGVESLNVSAAAAILLFEARRQCIQA
ncbi:RNA methyltransferase [soil metagenome]